MAAEGRQLLIRDGKDYMGDDMKYKAWNVGCRLTTFNAQGKCGSKIEERYYFEDIMDFMKHTETDIMVINEPGAVHKIATHLRRKASERGYTAIVKTEQAKTSEGISVCRKQTRVQIDRTNTTPPAAWRESQSMGSTRSQNAPSSG